MKTKHLFYLLAVGLLAAGGPAVAAGHDHDHHDHAGQPAKLQLDQGRKWPTDAALRASMAALRAAFAERLAAIHGGRLGTDEYKALGAKVDTEVASIVALCKLEPKADAMLHIVVADLVAGAEIMQGKARGKPPAGAHRAVTALNDYGRFFDHPDWKPLQ